MDSKTFTFPNPEDKHPDSKRMGYVVGYIEGLGACGYHTFVED